MTIPAGGSVDVMGLPIDTGRWDDYVDATVALTTEKIPSYICQCNVHSVVTAQSDPQLREALLNANVRAPDGAPIVWLLRQSGYRTQPRIGGPDLMWRVLERLENSTHSVFFYGSTDAVLVALEMRVKAAYPGLRIAGSFSPPFRPLSESEQNDNARMIAESGASLVFVGLGCPKQEIWMHRTSPDIPALLIGVGAAFDFFAGTVGRAPDWMQRAGLEWVHRLFQEPRRLWKRYLVTNSMFLWYMLKRKAGLS